MTDLIHHKLPHPVSDRQQALTALLALHQHRTPLLHLIKPLSPFARELCFGVCRYQTQLSAIASTLLAKKPKEQSIWLIILIAIYQLRYLKRPDYAVVQESLHLIPKKQAVWAKSLVNGVLRRYCRESQTLLDTLQLNPDYQYNHPAWLVSRLQHAWPLHWQAILAANDQRAPMTLRVNTARLSREDYLRQLTCAKITATLHTKALDAIILDTPCDVHLLPGFDDGLVSVQDAAAQLAVSLLDLKPGLRVLDACSAPGGKTGHLLEKEPSLHCTALDIDATRLTRVQDNLNRLKLQQKATLAVGDATHPDTWWDGLLFDRILLDAPCSATGVIRRHPDIKLLRTETEIKQITQTQQSILNSLWPLLKPNGRLVYATCSIMPEENEQQLTQFIQQHSDCIDALPPALSWGQPTGHGQQILPGDHQMDGFFYGVFQKKPI